MQRGFLFEPEAMARTELQDAIARLDFHSALRRMEEFQRVWPEAKLTWEPELVRAGSKVAAKPMDLDSGYGAWQKNWSAAEHARCFQILDSIAKAQLLFAASGLESEVV